jgi:DNA modification methylase
LHLGDCMELMPSLAAASIDLVLADLPYGTTRCRWDSPLPLEALWWEYRRVCTGPVVLFAQSPFDKVLGSSNISELRYEWIWEKGNATGHLNARRAPMKAHENILVFASGQPIYNPIITHGHERKAAKNKRKEFSPIYNPHDRVGYDSTSRYPRSVVKMSSDKQRGGTHPTQKPLALCEYLVLTHSNHGATVLDNCMGAGTTGLAALKHNRKFVGIEKDERFFEMACARLRAAIERAAA